MYQNCLPLKTFQFELKASQRQIQIDQYQIEIQNNSAIETLIDKKNRSGNPLLMSRET